MKWIKGKIIKWALKAEHTGNTPSNDSPVFSILGVSSKHPSEDVDNYTLRVWKANGGRCIQYSRYDYNKNTTISELYVVREDEDLGAAVTNIVVQQSLQGN